EEPPAGEQPEPPSNEPNDPETPSEEPEAPANEPGTSEAPAPTGDDGAERVSLGTQTASTESAQGCICAASGDSQSGDPTKGLALAGLLGLGLLLRRRRG